MELFRVNKYSIHSILVAVLVLTECITSGSDPPSRFGISQFPGTVRRTLNNQSERRVAHSYSNSG